MTSILLKNIGKLFWRMFLLQAFLYFHKIWMKLCITGKNTTATMCPPQCRIIRKYMTLECLLPADDNLDGLIKGVPARFLHYEVSLLPFVIKRYQRGRREKYFETIQVSCFSSNFCPLTLVFIYESSITTIIVIFSHSFYTYWLEFACKEELFLLPFYLFIHILTSIWLMDILLYGL